jgi:hypothetical protein
VIAKLGFVGRVPLVGQSPKRPQIGLREVNADVGEQLRSKSRRLRLATELRITDEPLAEPFYVRENRHVSWVQARTRIAHVAS